jgi:hypothetical protein
MRGASSGDRARIFLSCGQNKATEEPELAAKIGECLEQLGYDVYIATKEQSLLGIRENLFKRLKYSEYLVFIDFKREKLGIQEDPFHRVSLFSHQELPIAAYLNHPLLALQEEGIEQLDGMLGIFQANVIAFSDRLKLPRMVSEEIKSRPDWDPSWRNEIVLIREPREKTDPVVWTNGQTARFFHINAINRHKSQIANNCYVYLESIRNAMLNSIIETKTIELKWASRRQDAH